MCIADFFKAMSVPVLVQEQEKHCADSLTTSPASREEGDAPRRDDTICPDIKTEVNMCIDQAC